MIDTNKNRKLYYTEIWKKKKWTTLFLEYLRPTDSSRRHSFPFITRRPYTTYLYTNFFFPPRTHVISNCEYLHSACPCIYQSWTRSGAGGSNERAWWKFRRLWRERAGAFISYMGRIERTMRRCMWYRAGVNNDGRVYNYEVKIGRCLCELRHGDN